MKILMINVVCEIKNISIKVLLSNLVTKRRKVL